MPTDWGGGAVVVRGRESRPQGEGLQRDRSIVAEQRRPPVNTGAPWPSLEEAESRVRALQTKLHRWAVSDPGRHFDDLFNLVYDPAFLVVAWSRVRANKGARTAGVDGVAPRAIAPAAGALLEGLRADLKARSFTPARVREKRIPKASGKIRRLGIPTARDRVVQAALKLVLEPIFEADFLPCSYGFRPKRRAQDAIAEIHYLASGNRNYEWVFEADITACFDEIDHAALCARLRRRVKDKRILSLVGAFLRAGILSEEGLNRETITGTPQGGILSPLLANIALSVLDEHFAAKWRGARPGLDTRQASPSRRRRLPARPLCGRLRGDGRRQPRRCRSATGGGERGAGPDGPTPLGAKDGDLPHRRGLRLPGLAHPAPCPARVEAAHAAVYTYPSKKALLAILDKVRRLTRREKHRRLADLLRRLNPVLRGWCTYFRHGVSSRTFGYVDHFAFWRIVGWIRKRHHGLNWGTIHRRYLPAWEISDGTTTLYRPRAVAIVRYRYRGARIETPWSSAA